MGGEATHDEENTAPDSGASAPDAAPEVEVNVDNSTTEGEPEVGQVNTDGNTEARPDDDPESPAAE